MIGIGDPGRADSVILLSINPKIESMLMVSIPRDTKTEMVGKDFEDKINHAYSHGKTEMVKKSVENFINHSVDYVIQINMNGMRQLVDTFGGIDVHNKFAFKQADELGKKTHHYNEGMIHLDGERALHYSRMRKSDARGDIGRNERQRQVVQALMGKANSFSSITKVNEVVDILGDNMKTNVTFDDMKTYVRYVPKWKDFKVNSIEINGENETINGVYYYYVSEDERQYVSNQLKDHLSGQLPIINNEKFE